METKEAVWVIITVGTAPHLLTAARYGMDCNVAMFVCSIGTSILILGCTSKDKGKSKSGNVLMITGLILMAVTAYSFNASWIFLSGYMILLACILCKKGYISIKQVPVFFFPQ